MDILIFSASATTDRSACTGLEGTVPTFSAESRYPFIRNLESNGVISLNSNTIKRCVFKPSLNNAETFQQDDISKEQNTKVFKPI